MEAIIPAAMAVVLLLFAGLLLMGGQGLAWKEPGPGEGEPAAWPQAALLVPVAGAAADLADNLRSLLSQDYPDYQVIFITREMADPATPVISSLIPEYPRSRLIISGPAVSCGQKNHNLLAGLKALGEAGEILVFGDSTRLAPKNWMKSMVLPLVKGEVPVVSGYHHVLPQDRGLATWGRAITVLILYLTKPIPRLNQPWGGATAIKRQVFEDLQVARRWSQNVVDDVSLAALLQEKGLPVGLADPEASLHSPWRGETPDNWCDWLFRQWLYLKFCLPGAWLALGILFYLLAALVVLSALRLLAVPPCFILGNPWPGAVFLAALTGLAILLRNLHPQRVGLHIWLPAFYGAIAMAAWCHLCTWPTREIRWRGISYRVGWRGRVLGIKRKT
jgi:cellulose synthase/poly-beta-1,6-N-acetylglucosamine synthase-like glycosyltransferase